MEFIYCLIPLIILAVLLLFAGLRMLYQYERGVVFTLGKFSSVREPGLTFIFPVIQACAGRHPHQDRRGATPGSHHQGQHPHPGQRRGLLQGYQS
jgi:regulator of protease activity HflC (stomatin/prohibitin superfamily)